MTFVRQLLPGLVSVVMTSLIAIAVCAFCPLTGEASAETVTLSGGQSIEKTGSYGEETTFRTRIPKGGYACFEIADVGTVSGEWLELSGNYNIVRNMGQIHKSDGIQTTARISSDPGQMIELTVSPQVSRGKKATYTVKAVTDCPSGFELEPNDNKRSANALVESREATGIINHGDADWFVYKAPNDGLYEVRTAVKSTRLLATSMYFSTWVGKRRVNMKLNGTFDARSGSSYSPSGKGDIPLRAGQKMYCSILGSNPGFEDYDLSRDVLYGLSVRCRAQMKSPIVTVESVSRKKAEITWTHSGNVSGYQIRWAANRQMKHAKKRNVGDATLSQKTLRGLKPGKRYYVQIRAYRLAQDGVYGKTYTESTWSEKPHYLSWSNRVTLKTRR